MSAPAFESFFAQHRDRVLRYLLGVIDADEALDCLQETFLAALRAYPPADWSNPTGWVLTIARHKAIDAHRERGRGARPTADPEPAPVEAALPHPDLWAAVARLPEKQRTAVTLRYAADLPYREIARVLECREDAARQSVRAGLTRLREEYGDG